MIKSYGTTGLIMEGGATLNEDKNGLSTGTVKWSAPAKLILNLAPRVGQGHPYATWCPLETRSFTWTKGRGVCTAGYAGMNPQKGDTSRPEYDLQIGTNEEPIEVHPDFYKLAGWPTNEQNDAMFKDQETGLKATDPRGNYYFDGFRPIVDGRRNPYAGVEAYLDVTGTTWTQRYTTRSRPRGDGGVGRVSNPPGNPPSFGRRNWLYVGMNHTQRGDVYSVTKVWKLSGRLGWLRPIYDR